MNSEYTAATPTATACIIQHSICSITFPATMIHILYNGVQLRPNLVHCLSSAVSTKGRTVLEILNDADGYKIISTEGKVVIVNRLLDITLKA